MTLVRMVVLLVGGLIVMLCVVVLRAETTRLHFEISQCEREVATLRQRLCAAELELARLHNPVMIRAKAREVLGNLEQETAAGTVPHSE